MVLFLVVSQALAGDTTPPEKADAPAADAPTPEAPAATPATAPAPTPAAAPAPPVFDVVVVKKPVAPSPTPPTTPPAPAPFDVTVVSPTPATPRLGGEITPPPLPAGLPKPPPPPKDAPVAAPAPPVPPPAISALPGAPPGGPILPLPAPAAPIEITLAPPAPVAPTLPPGVGLRLTKGDTWRVKDAADLRYTTVQFARLVGDRETLRALDNAREFGKIGSTSLAITGGGLLVASLVVVTSNAGQPSIGDYSVDPSLYKEEADYDAAKEFAQAQYEKSQTEWQSQRLGSTLFLVGTGAVVLAAAPFVGRDNDKREQRPELVYSRERAQQWVDAYNAANPPTVVVPAPDNAEPAPAAPAAPPALPPDDDAPIRLELQPLFGVGFIGLQGSF